MRKRTSGKFSAGTIGIEGGAWPDWGNHHSIICFMRGIHGYGNYRIDTESTGSGEH
jgi:hypothetical protein